ncbi:hypothetical protein [Streptomyces sp. NPDC057496]|uniref:hypothetical protein n=1 Tax=Streptomyces sp. NPDC057496 TaxID=3346149 RepID=UPI0036BE7C94
MLMSPAVRTRLSSIQSFRALTVRAGADVELSNHPDDHGLQRAEQLRDRPDGPNPFMLGRPRTERFMAVMEAMLCGRIADAETTGSRDEPRPRAAGTHMYC